jgi:hypothetical protein
MLTQNYLVKVVLVPKNCLLYPEKQKNKSNGIANTILTPMENVFYLFKNSF